jgi:hypothetical protein
MKSGRVLDLLFAGLAAAQLGAAGLLAPAGERVLLPDGSPLAGLCLARALFGVPCPFCGMTRSFVALAHGDVGAARRFHPAGPILFAAMAALVAATAAVALRRGQPLVERRRFRVAAEGVVLVSLAAGVVNMVRS